MPDREIIHATEDVRAALEFSLDAGLQVFFDAPQSTPEPRALGRSDVSGIDSGTFHVVHPDWVFGPLQLERIEEGYNAGKYYLWSRTNFASVFLYFHGERIENNFPQAR